MKIVGVRDNFPGRSSLLSVIHPLGASVLP
ncbi:hypothetical protein Terro_3784 [Terriglobus roseus DSM 18391]|uniref:Uncharacterized protein n=1 Tax=Terriglobus roseus (strain DSM 18391 / NRRL B-41598 / KBS 63) TaxID=926566 RepID=I3ZL76_TERRK|nr:hypothetical protein Terro_3784 [Terriglobus roseus DSM 18391]